MFTLLFGNCTSPSRAACNPDRIKIDPIRRAKQLLHLRDNLHHIHLLHLLHYLIAAIMVLVAPRNGDYITLEELVSAVQAHAAREGYAIVKGRSKSIKGSDGFNNKVNLVCDRGGQSRRATDQENLKRKRKTASIKTGCPFKANAIRRKGSDMWALEVVNGEHNHEASDADACPSLCRQETNQALLDRLNTAIKGGSYIFAIELYR